MATAKAGSPEVVPINESVTISPVLCSSFCTSFGIFAANALFTNFFVVTWVCENIFYSPTFDYDPCSITATRSHIRWMTFISCVMSKIVIPISSLIFNNKSRIESVVSGSMRSLLHHLITLQVHVIAHEQLQHAVLTTRKFA